jgi:hypothetical protein
MSDVRNQVVAAGPQFIPQRFSGFWREQKSDRRANERPDHDPHHEAKNLTHVILHVLSVSPEQRLPGIDDPQPTCAKAGGTSCQ